MNDFDKAINAMRRVSLLAQLRDKVVSALAVDRRECGNCYFWMKSRDCPREHNINGRCRGPSCSDIACGKFQIQDRVLELKKQRIAEAISFAERHSLPIPH